MSETHIVKQGEYLSMIAQSYGFSSYHTIWDAPENAKLKAQRKNPNVLFPGDSLFIPERKLGEEERPTNKRHKFVRSGEKLQLRLVLLDLDGKPLANESCTLTMDGEEDFVTGSDGRHERDISSTASSGNLVDHGPLKSKTALDRQIPLQIGFLDPIEELTGQLGRLNNLGYNAGDLPERPLTADEENQIRQSPQFRSAVEEFQCDFLGQNNQATIKQVVTGDCDEATRAKLLEIHGC